MKIHNKKYLRKLRPFSLYWSICAGIVSILLLIAGFSLKLLGNDMYLIPFVFFVPVTYFLVMNCFYSSKYSVTDEFIELSWLNLVFKRFLLKDVKYIVVSNAYLDNIYKGILRQRFMKEVYRDENGNRKKRILPYITVHSEHLHIDELHRGMSSMQVNYLDNSDDDCGVGLFDSEAFLQILLNSSAKIYILSDVYERYFDVFSLMLSENESAIPRITIV